jgi:adenine-specific DNA-methyltransferase
MRREPIVRTVESLTYDDVTRLNIPTAEYQPVVDREQEVPVPVAYARRNRDLDPQLVWRGKDEQDWSDLVAQAPPLYIQEKVDPKVLIEDLLRHSRADGSSTDGQLDLFADFDRLIGGGDVTEFYQHEQNWSNRMILGDSLQVMASLAEREGLRGKVQCIYLDPPYGIKFNSNFQWSTTSRDVKDGNVEQITREPEQVKAFRDTWRDGIHSYLSYLRDRLTVARDLLSESGSLFLQISDENVHRVRALLDEVMGETSFVSQIAFAKTSGLEAAQRLSSSFDYILWYCSPRGSNKYRPILKAKVNMEKGGFIFIERSNGIRVPTASVSNLSDGDRYYAISDLTKPGPGAKYAFKFRDYSFESGNRWWGTTSDSLSRLAKSDRLQVSGKNLRFIRYVDDAPTAGLNNNWEDTGIAGFASDKVYVVQTNARVIERCILMTTDPGDLVLDPTCGAGTSAYVAEQWGRRWITIDTSRVALALARVRIMGARYPYYVLADSRDGQLKEAQVTRTAPSSQTVHGSVRQGFVYERVPHITLKSIANNAEIDVIWNKWQATLEPLREQLNAALSKQWQEWEIPRDADASWGEQPKQSHAEWWKARIGRQKEIDASIAGKAEFEYLYDKPYVDSRKIRVAGPFTVESVSPHRALDVDENGDLVNGVAGRGPDAEGKQSFPQMILENLRTAGVQQAHKDDRITFTALMPWPGDLVCAEGRYMEGDPESGTDKRAAIFIGPEFGTVSRPDLVDAAREAADSGFDVLIACAFNYEAHTTEFTKLGRVPVLKARMNADLHMADDLKNTGKGNLFVIFGEPDIDVLQADKNQVRVKINGVDVFHPNTGEVRSDGAEGIACWFIDTDYNQESFFVRHAYFLGANDPYGALKTTLKAEINEDAWATLNSDISRAFDKPKSGRIAVKVINHLGDEVMKVFRVD